MKRERRTPEIWIKAGLSELVIRGPAALAAEPLARKLKVTKGSFYWHFKDVPEFQATVIKEWQNQAFASVLLALEDSGTPDQRLRRFGKSVLDNEQDPAMRVWARTDQRVADAILRVDAERIKYLSSLLRQLGIANDDFARSSMGALVGLPSISTKKQSVQAFETLIDLVLALK